MKKFMMIVAFATALAFPASAVNVIVHPSNSDALDDTMISRIFLGKAKAFPGGGQAVPISLAEGSDGYSTFSQNVLNKSPSQLKAYWSKQVFTGKGTPPKEVSNDAEMIALISANPNMIGFIQGDADGSVKVAATY